VRLHLFSARRLSDELAAGEVSPRQQAWYLVVSFVTWLLPYYLGLAANPVSRDSWFAFGLYWMEFGMLVLTNVVGVFYCLRHCRTAPQRHFLVDFTCLYTPVSLVVLAATWAGFHAIAWALPRALASVDDYRTADYLTLRLYDVIRWLTVVGQLFLIYFIVGRYMRRTSDLRA